MLKLATRNRTDADAGVSIEDAEDGSSGDAEVVGTRDGSTGTSVAPGVRPGASSTSGTTAVVPGAGFAVTVTVFGAGAGSVTLCLGRAGTIVSWAPGAACSVTVMFADGDPWGLVGREGDVGGAVVAGLGLTVGDESVELVEVGFDPITFALLGTSRTADTEAVPALFANATPAPVASSTTATANTDVPHPRRRTGGMMSSRTGRQRRCDRPEIEIMLMATSTSQGRHLGPLTKP